jgi:hypothetical protein
LQLCTGGVVTALRYGLLEFAILLHNRLASRFRDLCPQLLVEVTHQQASHGVFSFDVGSARSVSMDIAVLREDFFEGCASPRNAHREIFGSLESMNF